MFFNLNQPSKAFLAFVLSVISCLTFRISPVNSVIPNPISQQNPLTIAVIPDLSGWRNTRWGMSMDQVKSLYPFTDGIIEADDKLRMVGKTNLVIDGHQYKVRFVFLKSYGLESVNFDSELSKADSYRVRMSVANAFKERYGQPDKKMEWVIPSPYLDMMWYLPSTIINFAGMEELIIFRYEKNDQLF